MKLFNDLKKLYCSPDELEAGDYFYSWSTNTHYRVLEVNHSEYFVIECIETGRTTPMTYSIEKALRQVKADNEYVDLDRLTKIKPDEAYMIFGRKQGIYVDR